MITFNQAITNVLKLSARKMTGREVYAAIYEMYPERCTGQNPYYTVTAWCGILAKKESSPVQRIVPEHGRIQYYYDESLIK